MDKHQKQETVFTRIKKQVYQKKKKRHIISYDPQKRQQRLEQRQERKEQRQERREERREIRQERRAQKKLEK